MSINHLQEACRDTAAELDAVLAELEPIDNTLRGGDMRELVGLAQACLQAAARRADGTDAAIGDGLAGLVQITTANLTGGPAAEGLELDAIGQIITTVQAGQRVAS
jgi:hypothetical protein